MHKGSPYAHPVLYLDQVQENRFNGGKVSAQWIKAPKTLLEKVMFQHDQVIREMAIMTKDKVYIGKKKVLHLVGFM